MNQDETNYDKDKYHLHMFPSLESWYWALQKEHEEYRLEIEKIENQVRRIKKRAAELLAVNEDVYLIAYWECYEQGQGPPKITLSNIDEVDKIEITTSSSSKYAHEDEPLVAEYKGETYTLLILEHWEDEDMHMRLHLVNVNRGTHKVIGNIYEEDCGHAWAYDESLLSAEATREVRRIAYEKFLQHISTLNR